MNRFLQMLTIVTGGSHNSSGLMLSNVISFAFRSPGEQETQSIRGPSGFGFDTLLKCVAVPSRRIGRSKASRQTTAISAPE